MSTEFEPNGHSREPVPDASHELVYAQIHKLRNNPVDLIDRLASFVGYELSRRREMGQLDPGDVLRDEVVDSAFASALTRLEEGVPIRDLHTYLRSRAQDMIRREVRRISNERRRVVSLDQIVASEDGEMGEEIRLADIIPDKEWRELDWQSIDAETLSYMIEALSDLPDRWRRVFLDRTIQGRSAWQIAADEGLDIDDVRHIVVRSRDFLRDKMENEYQIMDADDF